MATLVALKEPRQGCYGIFYSGVSDLFGVAGRKVLAKAIESLPPFTRKMLDRQLETFDLIGTEFERIEARIERVIQSGPTVKRLQTMPGVGKILGPVSASKSATFTDSRALSAWPADM